MPTDPKWRTIARLSQQRIGDVISVYVHLLVTASNADERGRTQNWNSEDVASALDLDETQVTAITEAMQGRVLSGDSLTGWEKRQPKREDNASERAKGWRERKRTQANADDSIANAQKRPDTDTDTDTDKPKTLSPAKAGAKSGLESRFASEFWPSWIKAGENDSKGSALKSWKSKVKTTAICEAVLAGVEAQRQYRLSSEEPKYLKHAATWLNQGCWADDVPAPLFRSSSQPHPGLVGCEF